MMLHRHFEQKQPAEPKVEKPVEKPAEKPEEPKKRRRK